MSEEILKALMQLFAIIAKQDEGVVSEELKYIETFLKSQLSESQAEEYLALFTQKAEVEERKQKRKAKKSDDGGLTKVGDSVRVLGICRKINRTLTQKQKFVVLVRLFEMVNAEKKFTEQRMAIIDTVADVFNIPKDIYKEIEHFVVSENYEEFDTESVLIINNKPAKSTLTKKIDAELPDGSFFVLQIQSVDLYFLKYTGKLDVFLNSTGVFKNRIYVFAPGSTIRTPKGKPVYYSDVVAQFMTGLKISKLSFEVNDIQYRFKSGDIGIRNISFAVNHGKLVGIMGASGSGKTTLVNALAGISKPTEGSVTINGYDLHDKQNSDILEGVIGYIPQDDLLIEELTVFQNLYYNTKLCFKDKDDEEIIKLVHKTLKDLGLFDKKDLKVGNPMNKTISGGQRKRLNIALELIREPSVLFVDEPTSGLSSRDSENVMELLSELTQKGKLIFVVIHQPSSDIYKMFDRMLILDQGGYMIYYGNPVEAVVYFKTIDNQINSGVGECPVCGDVKPELIFDIIEAEVVDEFGQYTEKRKISPKGWEKHFRDRRDMEDVDTVDDDPPSTLNIPNWIKQLRLFTTRDVLSKVSNLQYVILNLLEAPLLAFILSFLIRYIADPNSTEYIFYDNENIPPYIFMSVVVALFLGLTVSAEEIFRDRKILVREKFLNLSRSAYLVSKISILTVISAIQAITYVLIGNSILGIQGMYFEYWLILFAVFVFANMVGLNISQSFNSAVTIYILIPLIMIPLMALGGAMFSFDKLNRKIGSVDKVPLIAEFMVSRWAYEGLMVYQFKENKFQLPYFETDQLKSTAGFKRTHYIPALMESLDAIEIIENDMTGEEANMDSLKRERKEHLMLLKNETSKENRKIEQMRKKTAEKGVDIMIENEQKFYVPQELLAQLNPNDYDVEEVGDELYEYYRTWDRFYQQLYTYADKRKEEIIYYQNSQSPGYYNRMREKYHNEHLDDIVRNVYERNKILRYNDKLVRQEEPIYLMPDDTNYIGFRSHFYAPMKYFMGNYYSTFWFNFFVIMLMAILMYPPLYFEHMKKIIHFFSEKPWKSRQKEELKEVTEEPTDGNS
jgi:ABC-type multidrug transport system ATPase subunit